MITGRLLKFQALLHLAVVTDALSTHEQSVRVCLLHHCFYVGFLRHQASAGIVSDVLSGALPTFYAVTMVQ